jgi:hypothetical protein
MNLLPANYGFHATGLACFVVYSFHIVGLTKLNDLFIILSRKASEDEFITLAVTNGNNLLKMIYALALVSDKIRKNIIRNF